MFGRKAEHMLVAWIPQAGPPLYTSAEVFGNEGRFALKVRVVAVQPIDAAVRFEVCLLQNAPDTRPTHAPGSPLKQSGDYWTLVPIPLGRWSNGGRSAFVLYSFSSFLTVLSVLLPLVGRVTVLLSSR